MLKQLLNSRGQMTFVEYSLMIALAIAATGLMTYYFRRAVQAKVYDGRNYSMIQANMRVGPHFDGNQLLSSYEPYYVEAESIVDRRDQTGQQISSGLGGATYNIQRRSTQQSNTLSPRFYNLNLP